MDKQIWKVFVPHELLTMPDSYLFGHVTLDSQSVYLTASSPDASLANQPPAGLALIGSWRHLVSTPFPSIQSGPVSLLLSTNEHSELKCAIFLEGVQQQCTCIVYSPLELLKSSVLTEKSRTEDCICDNITSVVKILNQTGQELSNYEMTDNLQVYGGYKPKGYSARDKVVLWLLILITWLYKPVMLFKQTQRQPDGHVTSWLTRIPTVLDQLGTRATHLSSVSGIGNQSPVTRLKSVNKCVTQVLDSFLGICLMVYLIKGNHFQYVADVFLSYGDVVAMELKSLLLWLMGAPAGLKLNSQLTHFLANFFQYHIYLWTGYLYLLKPVLGVLVLYSSVAGVFGLTVQLALFQDIFTTLTLHIYCFYVYAARLYRLQVYALSSLWRLFRGKKWNVLRERVDSAKYDAGQLFVGTLLFTILLFLLPTTGLYYVVFTLLRLVILSIQGIVSKLREMINKLPAWTICLWLVHSPALTDAAVFHVLSPKPNKECALLLSLQSRHLSLSEAISLTRHTKAKETKLSWGTFVSNLLQGHLIYPWIDRK